MSGRRCVALVLSCAVLALGAWSATYAAGSKAPIIRYGDHYAKLKAPTDAVHRGATTLPFTDGFEGTWPGAWNASWGNWGQTTQRAYAGTHSAYCVQAGVAAPGPYPNNSWEWVIVGPFSTPDLISGQAVFRLWSQLADSNDFLFAGLSTDGSNFSGFVYDDDTSGWEQKTIPFTNPNVGDFTLKSQVWFGLAFSSDASGQDEGSYVDDASISGAQGGVVRGRIMGPCGRPLHGVCLTFTQSNVPVSTEMYTRVDGNYRKLLSPATVLVAPNMPGYSFTPATRTVNVTPGSDAVASFTATYRAGNGVVNRYALLVGISEYDNPSANLQYCDDDAEDLRNLLLGCGWQDANIHILLNSAATKAAIKEGIRWLGTVADADDIVLYYHSSHGTTSADTPPLDEARDGLDEYLCTYDLSRGNICDDELSLWWRGIKTRKYVVLLDTCFSGGHIRSVGPAFAPQAFDLAPEGPPEVHLRDMDDLGGGVVITACRDDETSVEFASMENGLFTQCILDGITSSFADLNQNGFVSAEELYSYARPRVDLFNPDQSVDLWDGYPNELEFVDLVPLMSSTVPARGATGVSQTADLSITWTWTVNQASAESLFKLKDPAGNAIAGTFTWPTPNLVMNFNPTPTLRPDSLYTVEVGPGLVLNTSGVKWYGDKFTFRTGGTAAIIRPLVVTAVAQQVSGGAEIRVNLSTAANVEAVITNIAGRVIRNLAPVDAEAGVSTLLWNGKSNSGLSTPAGQYLIRVRARDASGNSASFVTPLRK